MSFADLAVLLAIHDVKNRHGRDGGRPGRARGDRDTLRAMRWRGGRRKPPARLLYQFDAGLLRPVVGALPGRTGGQTCWPRNPLPERAQALVCRQRPRPELVLR